MPIIQPLPLSKDSPRWIYESFRRIELALSRQSKQIAAVDRGEAPTGGGNPIPIDLSLYFYLPGRGTGQLGLGNSSISSPASGLGLYFQAYNNFSTTSISLRSSRIEMEQSINLRAASIRITERDSSLTKGINVATSLGTGLNGQVAVTIDGTLRVTPEGSTEKFLLLESASVDATYGANKDDVIYRRLTGRLTGNFVVFESSDAVGGARITLSSIRKSDGAWVGPIASGAGIEHSDTIDRDAYTISCTANGTTTLTSAALFGSVQVGHIVYGIGVPSGVTVTSIAGAPNSITVSSAVTAGTEPANRTFASHDHTQYLTKGGPTGQHIGTPPSGTIAAGSLQVATSLGIGTIVPVTANREFFHVEGIYTSTGSNRVASINASNQSTGTVGSSQTTLRIVNSGASSRTAGSIASTGIDINVNAFCPAGLTEGTIIGLNMAALPSGAVGSIIPLITGCNAEVGTGAAISITQMAAATYTLRPGSATVGTMYGVQILCSSVAQQTGTVTNAIGIDLDSYVSGGTITGAGAVTNWYGLRRTGALPAAVTNKWFIYLGVDIPSVHTGTFRLGDNTVATHSLEILAGTTTRAPIRFGNGTNLTTPVQGVAEFDGTRLYITDGTPTRQTIVYASDIGAGGLINHNLLSATHTDTTAASVVRGDIITGQTGPGWKRLALGTTNYVLKSDGTDAIWGPVPAVVETRYRWIPGDVFNHDQSNNDKLQSEGSSGSTQMNSVTLGQTVETSLTGNIVIPEGLATLTSWKLYVGTDNTDTATAQIIFGTKVLTDGSSYLNSFTTSTQSWTPPGTANQIKVLTLTDPGVALTPGGIIGLLLYRDARVANGSDTHTGNMRVLGILLTYST